jgi:hypothetical protein
MPTITPTPLPQRHKLSCEALPQNEQQTDGRPGKAAHPTGGEMRAADRRTRRPSRSRRRYAIVPDRATQAQYIWDPDTDVWYGPFATRWDAEFTLVRWRTECLRAAPQNGANR